MSPPRVGGAEEQLLSTLLRPPPDPPAMGATPQDGDWWGKRCDGRAAGTPSSVRGGLQGPIQPPTPSWGLRGAGDFEQDGGGGGIHVAPPPPFT